MCQTFSHSTPHCSQLQSHGQQPNANLALNNVFSTNFMDSFPDTSPNQHITPDLTNLIGFELYLGNDYLHSCDSKGLSISNIEHTKLHTPKYTFILSNVLHVPYIQKPLLYVQKSCFDNNVYFKFHIFMFYTKDLKTKALLLYGWSKDGLHVLFEYFAISIPQACWSPYVSASVDLCYYRLGHTTFYFFYFLV